MSALTFYRRSFDSDVWHFKTECSLYPTDHFDMRSELPILGVVCTQCTTLAGRIAKPQATANRASDPESGYDDKPAIART